LRRAGAVGVVAGTLPASRISLPESASSRLVGITGSSASLPLSNRFRHSSPTEAGSRRYCSYITCTNAALWVPKTNSLTSSNLIRCQPSAISDRQIMRVISRCAFLLLGLLPCGAGAAQRLPSVRERLAARVAQAPATGVAVLPQPHAPGFAAARCQCAVSRGEHDEAPRADPGVSGRGRRAAPARRLPHCARRLPVARGRLAVRRGQGG